MKYPNILGAMTQTVWAIVPEKLDAMLALLSLRANGLRLSAEDIRARVSNDRPETPQPKGIAVLPLLGVLSQRMDLITESSGGTSTDRFARDFQSAVDDPNIAAIVLDVDSPGGSVYGLEELAQRVYAARSQKPIIAVANSEAGSAAYYVASQAGELVVTPGGEVGSIGTIAVHVDESAANEADGVKYTLIRAGKYKAEGNSVEPLGDEARDYIQGRVDDYYGMFVRAVARGRGVESAEVRGGMGQGRMVGAQEAVRLGMADRIDTLDGVLAGLVGKQQTGVRARKLALERKRFAT